MSRKGSHEGAYEVLAMAERRASLAIWLWRCNFAENYGLVSSNNLLHLISDFSSFSFIFSLLTLDCKCRTAPAMAYCKIAQDQNLLLQLLRRVCMLIVGSNPPQACATFFDEYSPLQFLLNLSCATGRQLSRCYALCSIPKPSVSDSKAQD